MDSEYQTCSKIIEIFWLLLAFLLFFFAVYAKFRLKKDVHCEDANLNSNTTQKYAIPQRQANDHEQNREIIMIQDDAMHPQQLQQQPQTSEMPTKLEEVYIKALKISSQIYPQMAIAIICVISGASYGFAVACVFLYLTFIILFNVLNLQQCVQSQTIQNCLTMSSNIWLLCIYINYLVCKLF